MLTSPGAPRSEQWRWYTKMIIVAEDDHAPRHWHKERLTRGPGRTRPGRAVIVGWESVVLKAAVAAATLLSALVPCDANAQQVEGNHFFSGFTAELNGLQAGGLYSVDLGEGYFRVVKVLALNPAAVHVLVYGNRFPARPSEVDPAALDVRPRGDPRGWGIHHLPLAWDLFTSWEP